MLVRALRHCKPSDFLNNYVMQINNQARTIDQETEIHGVRGAKPGALKSDLTRSAIQLNTYSGLESD